MVRVSFRGRHSLLLRVWHWAQFMTVSSLLVTVLLRKTVLSYRDNAVILLAELQRMDVVLTEDQAKSITRVFRDNMWVWHVNLGLVLAGLVVLRGMAELTAPPDQRLWSKLAAGRASGDTHYTAVKLGYIAFYALLGTMVATGLGLTWGEGLGLGASVLDTVKEVHEWLLWGFPAFVVVHLIGVVRMELTEAPGLVSDLFHGGPKA